MRKHLLPLRSFVFLGLLAGCGGGGGVDDAGVDAGMDAGVDAGADGTVTGYSCTRDPALMAMSIRCNSDDQCPCGQHCLLGACHHECEQDTDCEGWCDSFGYCRADEDRIQIGRLQVPDHGILQVYPGRVRLHPWSEEGTFLIRARLKDLGQVRIVADPGLLVSCDGQWVRECTLPRIALGQEARVDLKPDGTADEGEEPGLRVYAGDQVRLVSMHRVPMPATQGVAPGVYRGQVWIEAGAAGLLAETPLDPRLWKAHPRGFKIPFEVRVFPSGRLALVDPFQVLSVAPETAGDPPAPWVFQLAPDGSFDARCGNDDCSRRVILGGGRDEDDTIATEVSLAASGRVRAVEDKLMGTLELWLDGLGLTFAPPLALDERIRIQLRFYLDFDSELPPEAPEPELGGGRLPAFSPVADRYPHLLPFEAEVAGCGPLQPVLEDPAERAQQYLCYDHPGSDGMDAVTFLADTSQLTASADLRCDRTDFHVWALPILTGADAPGGGIRSDMMLSNCLADLACAHGAPSESGYAGGNGLDALSSCDGAHPDYADCIDGPLVLHALGLAMGAVERTGEPDQIRWETTSPEAARLGHRTLQQWIQVHTFVAREARQSHDALLGPSLDALGQALETSLEGWNVVLHPRVAGRLMHMPPEVLREPDYRGDPALAGTATADFCQPIGVSVTILEGLRAQLEAVSKLIQRARFENRMTPPDQLGPVMRHAMVMSVIAELLHQKACLDNPPPWEQHWQQARKSFDRALQDVLSQYRAQQAGENPLGIDELDLPLYRNTNPDWAGHKFSAISSYLIDSWAQEAIDGAIEARDMALSAWVDLRERQLQYELQVGEQEARLAEIRRNYGEKILELCGNPHQLTSAEDVLDEEKWPGLSADTCFLNLPDPACRYDEGELMEQLTLDDVNYQLCVAALLRVQMGERAALDDSYLNSALGELTQGLADIYDAGSWEFWSALDPGIVAAGIQFFDCLDNDCMLQDAMDFTDLEITGDEDLEIVMQARADCKAHFPDGVPVAKRIEYLQSSPMDKPECYHGSIGELVLAARAAAKDVEVARSELQDFNDAYQTAMNKCVIEETALQTMKEVSDKLGQMQSYLDKQQKQINWLCDLGSSILETVSFEISGDGPSLGIEPGALGKWFFGTYSDLSTEMLGTKKLRSLHESFMADFQHQMQRALCFNEAEMHLVGIETQSRRIERSMLDLSRALLQVRNAQAELRRLITEGRRRVRDESVRNRTSLFHDTWEDLWQMGQDEYKGAIASYRKKFRLAQRTLYLALRAVEYEWQKSHTKRADVLRATDPRELDTLLDELRQEIGTVSIGSGFPSDLHYVLSLKQQLLQLADRRDWPEGHHRLSDAERLRLILTDESCAVFDREGNYEGQLIPFSVMPLGVLGLGEAGTVSLLTGEDCAERIWLVNAVIQGEDLVDDGSSFIRIQLRHRNTFFSQWCLEPGEEMDQMQSASVRPSRNLFKDPVYGAPGENVGTSSHEQSEFTRARIQAYLNISQDEFSAEAYQQGSSDELACRALYGEYALFFPASYLALDGGQGLHLDRIDDILLRFDYVSVAKQW